MEDLQQSKRRETIERLLWPFVSYCLRRAVALPELLESLKKLYVRAAREELLRSNSVESASKIAAMTGVHRKDIARFAKSSEEKSNVSSPLARVMVQWKFDSRFSRPKGTPRPLSIEGRESEFANLVHSVLGGDINGYAILSEMERRGAIQRRDGQAVLVWQDFAPIPEETKGISMLAADLEDLMLAVEENIYHQESIPHLHLKTDYDNIAQEFLNEIRHELLREGSAFHEKINQILSKYDVDLNPALAGKPAGVRVAVGAFSFINKRPPEMDDKK